MDPSHLSSFVGAFATQFESMPVHPTGSLDSESLTETLLMESPLRLEESKARQTIDKFALIISVNVSVREQTAHPMHIYMRFWFHMGVAHASSCTSMQ